MRSINAKTLSLIYDAKEDRMLLLVNKNTPEPISYWITRRLYFSILFELDGYLDRFSLKDNVTETYSTAEPHKKTENGSNAPVVSDQTVEVLTEAGKREKSRQEKRINASVASALLLQNVNVSMTTDKRLFILRFSASKIECVSKMNQQDFVSFYTLMKRSFPKNEWGII